MMHTVLKLTLPLLLLFPFSGLCAEESSANYIVIPIEANFEPTSAVGIVMAPSGAIEITDTKIEQRDNKYLVSFNLNQESDSSFSTTAYLKGKNGETAFGNVKPVISSSYDLSVLNPVSYTHLTLPTICSV